MIGGYVNCVNEKWRPTLNNREEYNIIEADALNILGICRINRGTEKYSLDNSKDWYIKPNKNNRNTLGEILDRVKKINIKLINTK